MPDKRPIDRKERLSYSIDILDNPMVRYELRGYHRNTKNYSPEQALSGALVLDNILECYPDALHYYHIGLATIKENHIVVPRTKKVEVVDTKYSGSRKKKEVPKEQGRLF
jgi:hypothetical protein